MMVRAVVAAASDLDQPPFQNLRRRLSVALRRLEVRYRRFECVTRGALRRVLEDDEPLRG
jgi:hypothetical protein